MHKATALRVLQLFSLLPATLASVVCYDIASAMHPEILTPVDCWTGFKISAKSGGGNNHGGDRGGGHGPNKGSEHDRSDGPNHDDHDGDSHSGSSSNSGSYSANSDVVANLPFFSFAPASPLSSILEDEALSPPSWKSDSQIQINLNCQASPDTCYAMQSTLDLAAWYVSQIIMFKAPLQVNASLTDFCSAYGACNSSASTDVILGGAVPARTFPLVDDDGIVRYYPQAVVRQMHFPSGQTPQCGPSDVLMEFNSNVDFHYEKPDNTTIQPDQYDFLTVAIHELMHGLGFMSSWADYFTPNTPTTLTPQVALGNPSSTSTVQFEGLVEYAFDRLMSFTNHPNLYATNLSAEMMKEFGNLGTTYNTAGDLGTSFLNSPAKQIAIYMDGNATTQGSIQQSLPLIYSNNATIQSNFTPGPVVTLETSFSPFASGSSLNHVDGQMYLSTPDFLMRSSTPKGKTLQQFIDDYGTSGDTNYGPFGPGLRYVLGGIGYRIRGGIPLGGSIPNAVSNVVGPNGSSTGSTGSSAQPSRAERVDVWGRWTVVFWVIGAWIIFV